MLKCSWTGFCWEAEGQVMVIFLCLLVNWGNKRGPKKRCDGHSWQVSNAIQHLQKLLELITMWPAVRHKWCLCPSLERHCSSAAPCMHPLIVSFLLPYAPSKVILAQNSFLELDFVFLFGATFSVGFSSCTIFFRSWESTNLSLCMAGPLRALYLAPSWGSHRNSPCPLGLQLASMRCSHGSLSRSGCSAGHASWRSIDEPKFMWSLQGLAHMMHWPLPTDFFRGFLFLPLAEQAFMHPFPEHRCCITLVHSLTTTHKYSVWQGWGLLPKGFGISACPGWGHFSQCPALAAPGMERQICYLHEIFHAAINNPWPRRETYQHFSICKRNRLSVKGAELPPNPVPAALACRWQHILLLRGEESSLAWLTTLDSKGNVVTRVLEQNSKIFLQYFYYCNFLRYHLISNDLIITNFSTTK